MSSAGSEPPRADTLEPLPEVTLEALCKKGATVTRASEFLNEIGGLPTSLSNDAITSLCAFIASEQLENKDLSVGHAKNASKLSWDRFWQSLSEVQDMLVTAAKTSTHLKYTRLPSYVPACDTCENKKFECIRKIAPSTKCQVCSIRKKVCTRQDNANEKHRKSEDTKTSLDDGWLSDLDSEPDPSKESIRTVKQSKSASPSAQLESLLNDIDDSKKGYTALKTLSSPKLTPRWTVFEDTVNGASTSQTSQHRQRSNTASTSSMKRKLDGPSETNGKKRRADDQLSPPQHPVTKGQDKSSSYIHRPTVLQKSTAPHSTTTHSLNGSFAMPSSAPSVPRKYPRPPSPCSSEDGHVHRSPNYNAPSSSTHYTSRTNTSHILRGALEKKAREIISHIETEGCQVIGLRLYIMDMKTRLVELDKLKSESVPSQSGVTALEFMLRRAAEAVVSSLQSDGCSDVELRLMVLDLNTRLLEMDRDR